MKAIRTRYVLGPTNTKGARMIADDGDGNRIVLSYDHGMNSEDNHRAAMLVLRDKMNWQDEYIPVYLTSGTRRTMMRPSWYGDVCYWVSVPK